MTDLTQKTALVTSATRGIGLACAQELARQGARVYLGARNLKAASDICEKHSSEGLFMVPVYFDATVRDSYASMVETVISQERAQNEAQNNSQNELQNGSHNGSIDILVNNFGIGHPGEDLDLVNGSEEAFFDLLEMNLGSVYRVSKLVIPHMIAKGGGSIVNISSIGGLIPDISRIGYGVSKAAVNNITQQIALQYAHQNIRCNAVLPGLTATDAALKNMPESFLSSFLSHVPLGRMAKPEDIANAVVFFASEASSYITGHILDVAGGYGLGTPQYADMRGRK